MGCRKQSQGMANSRSGPKAQDPSKQHEKIRKNGGNVTKGTRIRYIPLHGTRTNQLCYMDACDNLIAQNLLIEIRDRENQNAEGYKYPALFVLFIFQLFFSL
ncbi:hypothetical protein QL285_033014 [Trifolium repens]|nr:hypothetical protein QL285_033014 [Trifolium repens]